MSPETKLNEALLNSLSEKASKGAAVTRAAELKTRFEMAIERATGRTIEEIRNTPITNDGCTVVDTGCGIELVSHEECNRLCDEAIRRL